jgi:hypothetical protein
MCYVTPLASQSVSARFSIGNTSPMPVPGGVASVRIARRCFVWGAGDADLCVLDRLRSGRAAAFRVKGKRAKRLAKLTSQSANRHWGRTDSRASRRTAVERNGAQRTERSGGSEAEWSGTERRGQGRVSGSRGNGWAARSSSVSAHSRSHGAEGESRSGVARTMRRQRGPRWSGPVCGRNEVEDKAVSARFSIGNRRQAVERRGGCLLFWLVN